MLAAERAARSHRYPNPISNITAAAAAAAADSHCVVQWALPFMHWLPAGILQLSISISMLWALLGPSLLAGIVTVAL